MNLSFKEYVDRRDEGIGSDVWHLTKGGIAGLGNLGQQAIRGGLNIGTGLGQAAYGTGQGALGLLRKARGEEPEWDTAKKGVSNIKKGLGRTGIGAAQVAGSPGSALVRGIEGWRQNGIWKGSMQPGGKIGQLLGLRREPDAVEPQPKQPVAVDKPVEKGEDATVVQHPLAHIPRTANGKADWRKMSTHDFLDLYNYFGRDQEKADKIARMWQKFKQPGRYKSTKASN